MLELEQNSYLESGAGDFQVFFFKHKIRHIWFDRLLQMSFTMLFEFQK